MNVLILGGSGGIGTAFIRQIIERYQATNVLNVYCTHLSSQPSVRHPNVHWLRADICSEQDVKNLAEQTPNLDWIVNAVGMLSTDNASPEKTVKHFDLEYFYQSFATNTLPTLLTAKYFGQKFKTDAKTVFATLSAKVGSISDNKLGGWYSYRSSKAALNMVLKTLSIEWARSHNNLCVAALHPGTVNTELSKPFQRRVPEHKLFTPDQSANYLLDIIEKLSPDQTGQFWSWDGSQIPW